MRNQDACLETKSDNRTIGRCNPWITGPRRSKRHAARLSQVLHLRCIFGLDARQLPVRTQLPGEPAERVKYYPDNTWIA